MGSGTTAIVSNKNNRNYIGIDIYSEYLELTKKRYNKINNKLKLFEE